MSKRAVTARATKKIENGIGRYAVIRNGLDYSVIDKQTATPTGHKIVFRGAHTAAWNKAIALQRENELCG